LHGLELAKDVARLGGDGIGDAMAASIAWPFSALACCGEPNQPVGAIERMSVSTG
jgi:hypothetical protein